MRKTLMALAVLFLVALPALAQAPDPGAQAAVKAPTADQAPAPEVAPEAAPTKAPTLSDILNADQAIPTAFPGCYTYQHKPCSTPGTWVRCQWTQYEPEICVCQENYTWQCG